MMVDDRISTKVQGPEEKYKQSKRKEAHNLEKYGVCVMQRPPPKKTKQKTSLT